MRFQKGFISLGLDGMYCVGTFHDFQYDDFTRVGGGVSVVF